MCDQVYSNFTATICSKLNEDGLQDIIGNYEVDDLKKIAAQETNEEAKMWLEKLILIWPQALEAARILNDELSGNWDEEAWEEKSGERTYPDSEPMKYKPFDKVEVGDIAEDYSNELYPVIGKGTAREMFEKYGDKCNMGFSDWLECGAEDDEVIAVETKHVEEGDVVIYAYHPDGAIVMEPEGCEEKLEVDEDEYEKELEVDEDEDDRGADIGEDDDDRAADNEQDD